VENIFEIAWEGRLPLIYLKFLLAQLATKEYCNGKVLALLYCSEADFFLLKMGINPHNVLRLLAKPLEGLHFQESEINVAL